VLEETETSEERAGMNENNRKEALEKEYQEVQKKLKHHSKE
jgi:hypothetical protein